MCETSPGRLATELNLSRIPDKFGDERAERESPLNSFAALSACAR